MGTIHHIALSALMVCSISGCGIYGKFEKPEMEEAEKAFGDIYAADSTSTGDISWTEFFSDKYLMELIDTAIANNTDLETAMLRIGQAEASLKSARLAYLPGFEISPSISSGDSFSSIDIQLPVSASWEIDIFGKLRNAKRRQAAAYMESVEYMKAVQSELICSVASQYYTLLALDAQKRIYEETEQNWKATVEMTEKLMEAGRYNAASVYQARANYYSVRNNIADIGKQIRETENQICSLLGKVSGTTIRRGNIEDWNTPESLSVGYPVKVLSNRPDVRQAELRLEQAFYNTGQARSEMYPSITISGSYDFGSMLMSALGSLVQPVFQQGRLRANLKIALSQQEEAGLGFRQALIDAGIEVNDAMISVKAAKEKSSNYSAQVENLEKAVTSTTLLMQNGSTTYLEVLTAQETLLNAQIGSITNRLNEISGVITLYRALGGGRE